MIPAKEFEGELWIRAADIHLLTKDKSHAWVGLTDEEIWKDDAIMSANSGYGATFDTLRDIVCAIEAKLREKNT